MSLFYDCLTLGDGLSAAFLWYMQLEMFDMKFEISELNFSLINVLVCAADADILA
jgi:hypothetical protein